MNSKEIKERIDFINEIYEGNTENTIFKTVLNNYQQMLVQIEILKSIIEFQPDPLGISLDTQIATFSKNVAIEYLKKINEI